MYLNPACPFETEAGTYSSAALYFGVDSFWAWSPTKTTSDLNFNPETGAFSKVDAGGIDADNTNRNIILSGCYTGPLA